MGDRAFTGFGHVHRRGPWAARRSRLCDAGRARRVPAGGNLHARSAGVAGNGGARRAWSRWLARFVQAGLIGINIVLTGLLIWRGSGRSTGAALAGAALVLTSPALWRVHSYAWSEALFILLVLAGMGMLALELNRSTLARPAGCRCASGAGLPDPLRRPGVYRLGGASR